MHRDKRSSAPPSTTTIDMRIDLFRRALLAACLLLQLYGPLRAQTSTDEIMMPRQRVCVAGLYTLDQWDHYWEGSLLRTNGNIGQLTRQTATAMTAIGLSDRINLLAALPWVSTQASAGQLRGVQGLQDLSVWLKAAIASQSVGSGELRLLAAAGFSMPASRYLPDYAPLSLGLGAPELSLRGLLHYQRPRGAYLRLQLAGHWRSYATIERDYYYTQQGYYTDQVDVPNAITYGAAMGSWLADGRLRAELSADGLISQGGHDIRRQDAGFPSNRVLQARLGGSALFYFKKSQGWGLTASGFYLLRGRNTGQSTVLTGGVLYQFGLRSGL